MGSERKRVLVCGGRDFRDRNLVFTTLDALQPQPWLIIEGGARGADALAQSWALDRRVTRLTYPAEWNKHGPAAGPIRNARMLAEGKPDLVIAFPGGAGTADMVAKARAAGVEVIEIGGSHAQA